MKGWKHFYSKIKSPRPPVTTSVLRAQQSDCSECVSSEDRMEENQTRYLPHCIIPPPSSHVPGNLDVREEQARPSNKRTFADLDGVDSRADSLVGFSAQPASGTAAVGEQYSYALAFEACLGRRQGV